MLSDSAVRANDPASWAPPRFRDKRLDGYRADEPSSRKALAAARRFASGATRSLVLAGATGVGKTHLAVGAAQDRHAAMMIEWESTTTSEPEVITFEGGTYHRPRIRVQAPPRPEWCSVPELIVGLRSDMDRDRSERTWADTLESFARFSGIVVLDDLGREKISDWTGETIYSLVNRRYEYILPTIVTTNLTGAELAASPYWPCISRLAEDGELVRVDGKDWRLSK